MKSWNFEIIKSAFAGDLTANFDEKYREILKNND